MLISLCTACHGRTHDLQAVMPYKLEAAAESPPVEICILNYNSPDDLDEYIHSLQMPEGVTLTYKVYTKRNFWYRDVKCREMKYASTAKDNSRRLGGEMPVKKWPDFLKDERYSV